MFLDNCTHEYKATKKQIVRFPLNEKKSKESQARLISWCWTQKSTWINDLITYNSHPGSLKLDIQGQGGGRILDVDGQGGWGVLKFGQFSSTYVYHPLLVPPEKLIPPAASGDIL